MVGRVMRSPLVSAVLASAMTAVVVLTVAAPSAQSQTPTFDGDGMLSGVAFVPPGEQRVVVDLGTLGFDVEFDTRIFAQLTTFADNDVRRVVAREDTNELFIFMDEANDLTRSLRVTWMATNDEVIGRQGPIGLPGPAGPAGADGIDGADGVDGVAGPQGPQGPQGPAGPVSDPRTYLVRGAFQANSISEASAILGDLDTPNHRILCDTGDAAVDVTPYPVRSGAFSTYILSHIEPVGGGATAAPSGFAFRYRLRTGAAFPDWNAGGGVDFVDVTCIDNAPYRN